MDKLDNLGFSCIQSLLPSPECVVLNKGGWKVCLMEKARTTRPAPGEAPHPLGSQSGGQGTQEPVAIGSWAHGLNQTLSSSRLLLQRQNPLSSYAWSSPLPPPDTDPRI